MYNTAQVIQHYQFLNMKKPTKIFHFKNSLLINFVRRDFSHTFKAF